MNDSTARVRAGTAQRQRGKDRVNRILAEARTLFINEGYAGLRLRQVAKLSGISLGNLTYYFGSKADLFESMIGQVLSDYDQGNRDIADQFADDPNKRLDTYLGFIFADCRNQETQRFFYQFWATASHDDFVANARERVYSEFNAQLTEMCRQVNPKLKGNRLKERVYLVVALIEGLHVVLGNSKKTDPVIDGLETEFRRQVFNIINS